MFLVVFDVVVYVKGGGYVSGVFVLWFFILGGGRGELVCDGGRESL